MIDSVEELDLTKENIQPLKKGRMISQLGNALLAQSDAEVHQERLKQREKFEMWLRTYEGDDPLEPWYEYVLWVEQNFLGDAREGNLNTVLERCLKQFKDDERYHQDTRYIELWLKYIEISVNPLEVYKKCIAHGIGKYSALFYVAWAHELENNNDKKRADQIYIEGIKNNAQPRDQLEKAQKDLHLRVGRSVLGGTAEVETVKAEQRVALNKLRAHGHKKNLVNNVRIGANSRGSAGILQPLPGNKSQNVPMGRIKVYNEEENMESAEFDFAGRHHLTNVPRRETLIKENTVKPGPWTGKSSKHQMSTTPVIQQPAFPLHIDEDAEEQNAPIVICNALKPRKLDMIEFSCPIAVFEPEDPTKRPMYCKNKVYAGGREFSFEELRAIEYARGNKPKHKKPVLEDTNSGECIEKCNGVRQRNFDTEEFSCPVAVFEPEDPTKRPMYCKNKVYADGQEFSFEELRAIEYAKGNIPKRRKQASHEDYQFSDLDVPVAVFEPPDPTKKPMYSKNLVYADGREYSFEELRAKVYNKRYEDVKTKIAPAYSASQQDREDLTITKLFGEELHKLKLFESVDNQIQMESENVQQNRRRNFQNNELAKRRSSSFPQIHFQLYGGDSTLLSSHSDDLGDNISPSERLLPKNEFHCEKKADVYEQSPHAPADVVSNHISKSSESREHSSVSSSKLSNNGLKSSTTKEVPGNALPSRKSIWNMGDGITPFPFHISPQFKSEMVSNFSCDTAKMSGEVNDQSSLYGQSFTYNTKEAMNIMQELWTTPDDKKIYDHHCGKSKGPSKNIFPISELELPEQSEPEKRQIGNFDIFEDDTDILGQWRNDLESEKPIQPEKKIKSFSIFCDENEAHSNQNALVSDKPDDLQTLNENNCMSYIIDQVPNSPGGSPKKESTYSLHNSESSEACKVFNQTVNALPDMPSAPVCIPLVPSPGMSEDEEKALIGTEVKENDPPDHFICPSQNDIPKKGILKANPNYSCDPSADPALEQNTAEDEPDIDVTCNTAAFSYPLLSSTPFISHVKPAYTRLTTTESQGKEDPSESNELKERAQRIKNNGGSSIQFVSNLSAVVETTKEYYSSGSSGVNTHCTSGLATQENYIESRYDVARKSRMYSEHNRDLLNKCENNCDRKILKEKAYYINIQKESEQILHNLSGVNSMPEKVTVNNQLGTQNFLIQNTCPINDVGELLTSTLHCDTPNEENELLSKVNQVERNSSFPQNMYQNSDREHSNNLNSQTDINMETLENRTRTCSENCDNVQEYDQEAENDLTLKLSDLQIVQKNEPYCFKNVTEIDPFDEKIINLLLLHIKLPSEPMADCYEQLNLQVPRFKVGGIISIGPDQFNIEKILGEGSYAKVYKAVDLHTHKKVALKVQKPSWKWEFYICKQLQMRLADPLLGLAFMDINKAYIFKNGSVMVTDCAHYGSLLSVINRSKQYEVTLPDKLTIYWLLELLTIAEKLQACKIIHGDIKPDNILLRALPNFNSSEPSLQLIDMGRSIDMTLFPEGTTFNRVVSTKNFQCIEMQTNRPWTYQTDLFGIAATVHCIIFGEYMKVRQNNNQWSIQYRIPRYNTKRHLWEHVFCTLLNVESCDHLPDIANLKKMAEEEVLKDRSSTDFSFLAKLIQEEKKKKTGK